MCEYGVGFISGSLDLPIRVYMHLSLRSNHAAYIYCSHTYQPWDWIENMLIHPKLSKYPIWNMHLNILHTNNRRTDTPYMSSCCCILEVNSVELYLYMAPMSLQALASHPTRFCKIAGLSVVLHHMSDQHSTYDTIFVRMRKNIKFSFKLHKHCQLPASKRLLIICWHNCLSVGRPIDNLS